MKILFIGDIVGRPGRKAVAALLPKLVADFGGVDVVIANGENAAGGKGLTPAVFSELTASGVDVVTTGNHVWDNRAIFDLIDETPNLIRPANFPLGVPGVGWCIHTTADGRKVAVLNLIGQVYMSSYENPFLALDTLLPQLEKKTPFILIDFHAEATAEKVAMGWYADGKVSAVVGTHTHVQTADEQILPQGTAYITDVGMTGPHDSVIGIQKEDVLYRFRTTLPTRYEVASGNVILCGVMLHLDDDTGKAVAIQRIRMPVD